MKLPSFCWPCLGSQQAVGCTPQAGAASATQKNENTAQLEKKKTNKKKDLMILSPVLTWQGINLLTDGSELCLSDATGEFFAYEVI